MRSLRLRAVAVGALLLKVARAAASAKYITDLPAYSLLAPCATSALSYNVGYETMVRECEFGQEQSCVCSNAGAFSSVMKTLSSDISTGCGNLATEDQSSASLVFKQFCTPSLTVAFSTPTTNIVDAYITDLSEMEEYLAPCASSGLSSAVMGESLSRCPEDPSLLAPCVCSKTHVVEDVSKTIAATVRSMCSNDEDVTSAYSFFGAYCAMNQGTTSFGSPEGPPGDMTYDIVQLHDFTSLDVCAKSAVSTAVLSQTYLMCASGPQALASCVCLKSGMRDRVSKTLTSEVRFACGNTATQAVSSALDLLDYYCSAASGDVVAQVSVTGSTTQAGAPSRTSSMVSNTSTSQSDNSSSGGMSSRTGAIVGGVVGGIAGILAVAAIGFYVRHRHQRSMQQGPSGGDQHDDGRPELTEDQSPIAMDKGGFPMTQSSPVNHSELSDQGLSEMPHHEQHHELHSPSVIPDRLSHPNAHELP